jgi:RecA-family ATPase
MPSLEPLPSWCELVQDAARRRELLTALDRATKAISTGEATEHVVAGLSVATLTANAERGLGSIVHSTFNDLLFYDTECDRNTLIGNRWLCKGGSVLINAQSGIGKSSLTMQLAIGWALHGIGAFSEVLTFGLIPVKPLKSLIIQAENDQGDQAEVLQSVFCKYGKSQCGEAERDLLNERVIFYRDNIHSGPDFLRVLETLVLKHTPDVVWIDPLMCYLGDDISDQAVVTKFCNELNRISSKTGVLLAIIHHLPKPKENSARTDSDLAYSGFGSSALTNWAREVITLQRVETEDNQPLTCSLTMTKRRLRSNIKCFEKGLPTSKIYIRHSPTPDKHGMIWQQCYKPEPVEEKPKKRK